MSLPYISIHNLFHRFSDAEKPLLNGVSLNFSMGRYGVVGSNGSGKSTLLKLLLGEKQASSGSIERYGKIATVSQLHDIDSTLTVAQLLEVDEKLDALNRIMQGSTEVKDFDLVGDDWNFPETVENYFSEMGLRSLPLDKTFSDLSGGERTRLMLVKAVLKDPDFLILDEPTNNLDQESRIAVYHFIQSWKKGLIVASHDRDLLRCMDQIIELTSVGAKQYGGAYDFFVEQKSINEASIANQLNNQLHQLENKQEQVQKRLQQHLKNENKGIKAKQAQIKAKGSYDKIQIKSKQGQSQNTLRRVKTQAGRQLDQLNEQINLTQEKIPIEKSLNFSLESTLVPSRKVILNIQGLRFNYWGDSDLFEHFNFSMVGPERIALKGCNGSGKSTLIKLILGKLSPAKGEIYRGFNRAAYLDQHCSALDDEKTILDNYQDFNPDQSITESYTNLAQFKFRNKKALAKVSSLSGGERLRALLCCALMSKSPPEILILDEPTNHLDIESIEYLEQVLNEYQGALLVVSHDEEFLNNIAIKNIIKLAVYDKYKHF